MLNFILKTAFDFQEKIYQNFSQLEIIRKRNAE
jgi:hypothetical protein